MSVAKKQKPPEAAKVVDLALLRQAKLFSDQLGEKIRQTINENPRAAQKAAFILTLWIRGSHKVNRSKRNRK